MNLKKFFNSNFYEKYFKINSSRPTIQTYDNYYGDSLDNYKKYENIIKKHFNLNDKIQVEYSIAVNQPNIFNSHTEKCIELCIEDIKVAPLYKEYLDSGKSKDNENNAFYGMYSAFPTLAKIYEKQKKFDKAILICIASIKLGFAIDHSKAGMQGRLARLIKKFNQNSEVKLQYDYEKNILFDDETGEPIILNEED